jgi:PAS domain S-box-containing protein
VDDDASPGDELIGVRGADRVPGSAPADRVSGSTDVPAGLPDHLDASPWAVAVVEPLTHDLRYVNAAFRRFTHTECEPVLGRPLADALPECGGERIAALLRRVDEDGDAATVLDIELEVERKGGEPVFWSVSVWPVDDRHGQQPGLVLQMRDVTADAAERRRRTEMVAQMQVINERLLLAALREEDLTQQARVASETKSVFLATMSHELRTPLTAIIGYEELLDAGITGPVTAAQQVQLARIKASAAHLLALIDEVLSIARIDTGREQTRVGRFDVRLLCDQVSVLVAPLVRDKKLTLRIVPPERRIALESDSVKIRQILVNLVGNAIKFTDAGEVSLSVQEGSGDVQFRVSDTGVGIRREHLDRIFDDFWQVEQRPTRTAGGSGLGLAISRRLARMIGGDITVDSVYGVGSTFVLRVPLQYEGLRLSLGDAQAG